MTYDPYAVVGSGNVSDQITDGVVEFFSTTEIVSLLGLFVVVFIILIIYYAVGGRR